MPAYHKLVRDKIPQIIADKGEVATWHTADEAEYKEALYAKLLEEAGELARDRNITEAADLMEVLAAVLVLEGWSSEEVERVRVERREKRGGFEERIILEES
jgi:predicted house-cleaning noncanonical NTP pyrophosphatase (MazG superfamily)